MPVQTVDYDTLDDAKGSFIAAAKRTLTFGERFGFVPGEALGASANIFSINLKPFLSESDPQLHVTLVPEGLGTADDARPEDLTSAELTKFWFNIGIKTIAVMTNDVATSGLQTILIGLYLPSSTPETVFTPEFMHGFLDGIVEGCRTVGCVYLSGETPQLKTKIIPGTLDIAGAAFGILPTGSRMIQATDLAAGDLIVMVESSGPHENGFTTLREIAVRLPEGYRTKSADGKEFWEGINAPSKLYTPLIQDILQAKIPLSNIENITGHGWQKLMRPKQSFRYRIHTVLPRPPVFDVAQKASGMTDAEMLRVFNCGAGLALFVKSQNDAQKIIGLAALKKMKAAICGVVEACGGREVVVEPLKVTLSGETFKLKKG